MFKRLFFLLLIVSIALSACGTLQVGLDQTPTPAVDVAQVPMVVAATPTVFPSPSFTPEPTQTFTQPATENPAPDQPSFSNVSFFTTRGSTADCPARFQDVFPSLIRQVHARWNYTNMRAGLTVRREWYHDGKLWLQRDQDWDFAKYGKAGVIKDISIYDFDAGLGPGKYELRLYIDGQPQFNSESKISFLIDKTQTLEIAAPNGRLTAIIADPQKLMIREANGVTWELVSAHFISSLAWFADGKHILYSDTDRSQARGCTTIGIRHKLWIIDAATGQQHQIGSDEENLHAPMLSPDERYIAALSGSNWYDACMVDLRLVFIELGPGWQQVRRFTPQDFAGFPAKASDVYPDLSSIMAWQDSTHFKTALRWTCLSQTNDPSAIYVFNLAGMQVTRAGDLPKP